MALLNRQTKPGKIEAAAWLDAGRQAKQFDADLSVSAFNRGTLFP